MAAKKYKTKWDLHVILSKQELQDIETYRKKAKKVVSDFIKKWSKDKSYLEKPKKLREALDELDYIRSNFGVYDSEGYYRWLDKTLDQTNPKKNAAFNKIHELTVNLANEFQFFEIELSKVAKQKQKEFIISPELKDYKHFLERLFAYTDHILTEPEERIMNLKAKTSGSNWSNMISSLLSKQERETLDESGKKSLKTFEEIMSLLNNPKKKVRDTAAKVLNELLDEFKDFTEHEFNSLLENKKVNQQIRNYTYPDQSRHLSDDVDTEVVHTLINTVTENFDITKKYYSLKAKLFGFEKLAYHERNLEYGKADKKIEFDEAYTIISKVFGELDPEFQSVFLKMMEQGQVDVYPKKGKHGGAFCIDNLYIDPIYVMLNYTDRLDDVLTVAHEFGHAIHSHYSKTSQNSLQSNYSLATAETASTFFEDFVLDELSKEVDDELRLSLYMKSLDDYTSTLFRQIAAYNFELDIHGTFREKGYLSHIEIGEIFTKHMKSYMGKAVNQDEGSQNWWIYWSHFRSPFYVYSYAFGMMISKSLQSLVKQDKSNIEKVKQFLKAGGSKSVKDIFKDIGVNVTDKTFWEAGLNDVRIKLKETEKLAKKLGKI